MKIGLVILHADVSRGGAERYSIDLAAALARDGHEVALLATSFNATPTGVGAVELNARGFTRIGRYERFLDSLDAHLAQTRYDIVHAMLPVRRCDVYHPHAGIALAAMKDWNVHFNPRRKAMAQVERELLGGDCPPVVLCLSEYVKSSIREHYSSIDSHLSTLFNAVNLHRFEPANRPARQHVNALIVAQDFQRKGLRQVIEAMAQLSDPRLHLIVVGKEPTGEYEKLAAKLGILGSIRFHGPTTDTRPFYQDADFFVLPTKHDPCSLVVLEALSMGLPVISTRFNGACEIMTTGVHGLVLTDPEDIDALSDAMRQLLDPARRATMSRACLELRPTLSYENHLRTLLEIYQRIMRPVRRAYEDE